MTEVKAKSEIKKLYDGSFPHMKKGWRHLCLAAEQVGWKDLYFMVLRLQQEANNTTEYKLLPNRKV